MKPSDLRDQADSIVTLFSQNRAEAGDAKKPSLYPLKLER